MSMRSLLASVAVACVAASASAELEITEICARCQSKVPAQKGSTANGRHIVSGRCGDPA